MHVNVGLGPGLRLGSQNHEINISSTMPPRKVSALLEKCAHEHISVGFLAGHPTQRDPVSLTFGAWSFISKFFMDFITFLTFISLIGLQYN